jgi:MFS family permease
MALGSLFYAVGVGSIAFYSGFWGFWLGMVVMSAGELILVPTATTFAANKAPADMRGRYMSIYGLTQGTAQGIGPILGGLLNDHLGPRFIWLGAFVVGMIAMAGFWVMNTHTSKRTATAA